MSQALALPDDPLEDLLAVGRRRHVGPPDQGLGHAEDDRDRGPQLVADHGQELVLEAVDLLQPGHR